MEIFKGHWTGPLWVPPIEWVEKKKSKLHIQQVLTADLFPLLTLFHLCYLFDSLTFVCCCFLCLLMSILFFCSGLAYIIYSRGSPFMYIYCMVCYCVIAAPYVRSIVVSLHTVTLLMMSSNAQYTMSFHYSLQFFLICQTRLLQIQ